MILTPEMAKCTQWRADGNFYVAYRCVRCGDRFYEYAMQNQGMNGTPRLCGVCRGHWSASEEAYRNARIEAQ